MMYDVIIVGAGPGGIFSAYELVQKKPGLKIAVFEAGNPLSKRHCPIDGEKVKSETNDPRGIRYYRKNKRRKDYEQEL